MEKADNKSSFAKILAFIIFAVVGFIIFNFTANGIFALKRTFHKDSPKEQAIIPSENKE